MRQPWRFVRTFILNRPLHQIGRDLHCWNEPMWRLHFRLGTSDESSRVFFACVEREFFSETARQNNVGETAQSNGDKRVRPNLRDPLQDRHVSMLPGSFI